jgi:hypothetical protein
MGPYPFGVFHTSLGSTLCTESELKSDLSLGVPSSLEPSTPTNSPSEIYAALITLSAATAICDGI